jgi:arginine N-succinyltransferase
MSILIRSIRTDDVDNVLSLARQFSLLNLPVDRRAIEDKIENSISSFKGELERAEATYLFVVEDTENKRIAASSQILAKHGNPGKPTYSFEVLKKERFSKDLGIGFIHQILRLKINEDGPTEVGGLVVDRNYRSRPERVGKAVSLGRFLYMGMCPERFENFVYAQMAPPLTEEGRSEFWESLGRRFTGMPYQEADLLSQQNQEFIRSLFPEEDIYLCLLDSKARLVLGRVGQETQPALHMLESIGFKYMQEVDPFDGGPHLGCKAKDIALIKNGKHFSVSAKSPGDFNQSGLVGVVRESEFFGSITAYAIDGEELCLPDVTKQALELSSGETVYFTPMDLSRRKGKGNV